MKNFFLKAWSLLIFSRRRDSVRRGIIFIFTQFILLLGIVLFLELIFIFLGANDIFLPFTRPIKDLFERILF